MRYQKGEAITVLIIILVIALCGALGFIAWQNFGKKDDAKNTADTSEQTKKNKVQEEQVSSVDSEKVLAFPRWGVEIPIQAGSADLSVEDSNGSYYVKANLDGCTADVGVISQRGRVNEIVPADGDWMSGLGHEGSTWGDMANDNEIGNYFVVVGDYVYSYRSPQAVSCNDAKDSETQAIAYFRETLFSTLQSTQ